MPADWHFAWDVPWQGLNRLREKSVSREIRALWVGVLCRPFGTRVIDPILPGTPVPGYRLFRPCGTDVVAVSKSLRTSQQARKDADYSGNIVFPRPVKLNFFHFVCDPTKAVP
jgi:hypothetical protein